MPNGDLHQKLDRRVIELSFSPSFSRSGGSTLQAIGSVACRTRWTPNFLNVVDGIAMTLGGLDGAGPGTPGTYATLSIPLLGVSVSHTVSGSTLVASTCRIEVDNLRVYSWNGGILEVRADAIRWYVDGVVRWSTGAVYLVNAFYFAPSGIPLFGIPPEWSAVAGTNPVPILGATPTSSTPGTTGTSVNIGGGGSWVDRETPSSDYVGYPCFYELATPPGVECECPAEDLAELEVSDTSSITFEAHDSQLIETTYRGRIECSCPPPQITGQVGIFDVYDCEYAWTRRASSIVSLPNLPNRVKRLDPNTYRAMIFRGGFPRTQRTAFSSCETEFPVENPEGYVINTVTEQVHPRQSNALANVGAAAHAIEDTFGYSFPSPASRTSSRYASLATNVVTIQVGVCANPASGGEESPPPPPPPAPCFPIYSSVCMNQQGTAFAPLVDSDLDNPYMLGYLYHVDALSRYVNYWGGRHWSYFYWFPQNTIDLNDDGYPDAQDQWSVYGAPAPVEYWLMKGDQWEYQSALPSEEQTRRRTTLVSAPLVHGCQGLFIQNLVLGVESSWWGDVTFKVDETLPAAEIIPGTDSSPDWSFVDCSGALDSTGVVLTPDVGKTQVIAEFALGNFERKPYLFPHICDRFYIDWEDSNVAGVTVYLVGQSGSLIKLTEAKGEAFRPVTATDDKYAGSWLQDFGVGLYLDEGADLLPEGVSASYMANPELVHAFSLLAGRTAKAIRFVVDVEDDGSTAKILYPKLRSPEVPSRVYQENKSQASVVWENRPGIRFGNTAWYYDSAHHATPIVLPPGYPPFGMKPTALDWLTFRRLMLEAKAYNDGLGAEISSLYDAYEATTPAAVDNFSGAFLIPSTDRIFPRAALTNGASCPPLLGMPRRARGADWKATGDFAQESVSHTVEPRFFIGNDTTHLHYPGDGTKWTTPIASLEGWPVTKHLHEVDNTEGSFFIQRGSKKIAIMSPWQGCFSVRKKGKLVRDLDLHNFEGLGLMFEAWATDEDITVVGYNIESPAFSKDAIAYESEDIQRGGISIVCKSDGTILVVFEEEGAVKAVRSLSLGEYWSSAVALGFNGKWVDACEDGARGIEFVVCLDHTAGSSGARPWKVYRKLAEGESFVYVATIVTQAEADVTGGNIYFSDERGRPLIFSYSDSGTPRRFRSFDHGETWAEVS
ncbi:hypothetical protein [Caudoviricetes sp.]|nr:hypothetical protein [Caudoviricetes sp.]